MLLVIKDSDEIRVQLFIYLFDRAQAPDFLPDFFGFASIFYTANAVYFRIQFAPYVDFSITHTVQSDFGVH